TAMKRPAQTREIRGAAMGTSASDIMLMSTLGSVIRLPANQLRTIGRTTQGVSLKKLDSGEFIASVTVGIVKDDDGDGVSHADGTPVELTAE
ncbi:MAG: DNA gyrase C-terminal beta-propeller domain-containing protein, partial [Chloroflexota bacterium]